MDRRMAAQGAATLHPCERTQILSSLDQEEDWWVTGCFCEKLALEFLENPLSKRPETLPAAACPLAKIVPVEGVGNP
jgi:hypothetical protein